MGELAVLVDEKVYKNWFTIADSGARQLRHRATARFAQRGATRELN